MNVRCPHCQAELDAPPSLCGSSVTCPACKKSFVVDENPHSDVRMPNAAPLSPVTAGPTGKSQIVPLAAAGLALAIGIAALAVSLCSSGMPQVKFSKDAPTAVRNCVTFQIEIQSVGNYFWKKNGRQILKSLEIKEIKTNGSWAVAFYKLSLGATDVKETMFLYKTEDGYWVRVPDNEVRGKCPSGWYDDMKVRISRFTKDSGEFDVFNL